MTIYGTGFPENLSTISVGDTPARVAFASPTLTQRLTPAPRSMAPANDSFEVQATEQPPNMWLMGGVILLLIGYQLRRKHRLLRPHRFHEL